ncbi:MAG TPA: efflux RND transporter periplasmic adaptor subunit [Vicinamibacteria bacterium]|nr:efflux RND transporter periplasmic adaptor subunit [Vicinamibacteria bacterium]
MRPVTIAFALAAGILLGGAGYWLGARQHASAPVAKQLYHCPMHPTYVSDKPGECPICHMTLVPIGADGVTTREPAPVAGRASVALTPERRQILGLRTEAVAEKRLYRTLRTVGRVAVDERRLHHVHVKYDGYVEQLFVDFTGKYVRAGEPLLGIYSPDLVATQQEYLLAFRARRELLRGGADLAQGSQGLLEAARQRLLFWDIRPEDITRLETTGEVMRALRVYAEHGGYVVQKMAYHGMRVTPADTLYDIADLSHLWVLADVYESDLPLVRLGMRGELSVPYLPGQSWSGAVTYIAPTVEEQTRTVKVRLEVENEGDVLKPDMFADVVLKADLGQGLALPEGAVIDTGERKLVFVDAPDGHLEPREVQLGAKVGSEFQVLAGLAKGERVATSANFLLDSESSLKAAIGALAGQSPAPGHRH